VIEDVLPLTASA
jgi:hypothetical protein